MPDSLSQAVVDALAPLSEAQQLEVIAQAKATKPAMTAGERQKKLLEFAGSMSKEDADELMAIIEEGCGQINHAAWE